MKSTLGLYVLVIFLSFTLVACSGDGDVGEEFENNYKKSRARAILKSLELSRTDYIEKYISPDTYIQHNLSMPDGRQYLIDAIASGQYAGTGLTTWRAIAEGEFVVTHTEYLLNGVLQVGFDVFRFENNLIVEHWDNLQDKIEPVTSGRGMINGSTGFEEMERKDEYKALVERFTKDVLINRQTADLSAFFRDNDYIQHSVMPVGDGVEAWRVYLDNVGDNLQYTHLHQLLGEGNYVFAMSEGFYNGTHSAFHHLYRLREGKIIEHWDVIQSIPARETWANDNGKF